MVISPFAIPNSTMNIAAAGTDTPAIASSAKAASRRPTASRAIASGCTLRANTSSQMRAATCDGPNNVPIATTVPASSAERAKIASRWADNADGTNA